MTDFPFDIVGFDLDGTLFDTKADLAAALNHALAQDGRPALSVEAVEPMVGRGTRFMLQQGLEATGGADAETAKRLYADLLDYYDANIANGTTIYPGLIDALDLLAGRGVKLAIVTNKLERLAAKLVAALGMTDRFACLIGGDTVGVSKPAPEPILEMVRRCGGGRAAFVGDSIFDTQAARNASVPSVAVSFGFRANALEELGADVVIDHYAELVPALERLGA